MPGPTDRWAHFPGQEPTAACKAALALMAKVHDTALESVAGGNAEDPNLRMFANESARRLHLVVYNHVVRYSYSMIGALQLKRDLGEYEGWVGAGRYCSLRHPCALNPHLWNQLPSYDVARERQICYRVYMETPGFRGPGTVARLTFPPQHLLSTSSTRTCVAPLTPFVRHAVP
jgi:hypothetical protein